MLDSRLRGNDTLGLARPGNDRLLHSAKMLLFVWDGGHPSPRLFIFGKPPETDMGEHQEV